MGIEILRALGLRKDAPEFVACPTCGPGEAAAADYGVAGGRDRGLLFRKGEKLRTVPFEGLADALADLIRADGIEI